MVQAHLAHIALAFESVELAHADSPATMVIQALLGSFDASVTSAVNSTSSMVHTLAGHNERKYPLVNSAMTFNTQYRCASNSRNQIRLLLVILSRLELFAIDYLEVELGHRSFTKENAAPGSDTGLLGVYYVTELDKIREAQWVSLGPSVCDLSSIGFEYHDALRWMSSYAWDLPIGVCLDSWENLWRQARASRSEACGC